MKLLVTILLKAIPVFCLIFPGLGHGDNYEDKSLDVFQYFNTSCFTGFNDDEKVR